MCSSTTPSHQIGNSDISHSAWDDPRKLGKMIPIPFSKSLSILSQFFAKIIVNMNATDNDINGISLKRRVKKQTKQLRDPFTNHILHKARDYKK